MGISAFIHNFNKNMIVCRMEHEKPHCNIAYEFFRYKQTQASLPYIKQQSSIVTTQSKETSSSLKKINKKNLTKKYKIILIIFWKNEINRKTLFLSYDNYLFEKICC
jgi:hypothetical protein